MSMHTMISRVYFARQEQRDQLKASLQTEGGNGRNSDGKNCSEFENAPDLSDKVLGKKTKKKSSNIFADFFLIHHFV